MTKKIITILIAFFTLLLFSNIAFAENAGEEVKDSWDKTTQSIQNAGATVGNTMKAAGNNIEGSMKDAGNKVGTTLTGTDNMKTNNPTHNNSTTYNATRTSTNTGFLGMSSNTMWTWFVFSILAVAIVGLVWYYGMQNTKSTKGRNE